MRGLRMLTPLKQQISVRADADVPAWFRSRGKKYQTHMNAVLRRQQVAQTCFLGLRLLGYRRLVLPTGSGLEKLLAGRDCGRRFYRI
jgi:hypothetical protein